MIKKLSQQHQATTAIKPSHLSFSDYMQHCRTIISQRRTDLSPANRPLIIDANAPFELLPQSSADNPPQPKRGVLLVHGLLDSPFAMRDLAHFFHCQGFWVRAILLPGHGTTPADLMTVTMEDWLHSVQYGINSFAGQVDELYLSGISAGAALSALHALEHTDIKALLLFAPAFKLNNKLSSIAYLGHQMSKIYQPLAWYRRRSENDYSKYQSFPFNLGYQAHRLTQQWRRTERLGNLTMPIFMVLSQHDETISSAAAYQFFTRQSHPQSRLIIYGTTAPATPVSRIEFRQSAYPELKILDFSHVALHIAPNNPHYGKNGDYRGALSIPDKKNRLDSTEYFGALSKHNLRHYALRRLTYNPDFTHLTDRMEQFLHALDI